MPGLPSDGNSASPTPLSSCPSGPVTVVGGDVAPGTGAVPVGAVAGVESVGGRVVRVTTEVLLGLAPVATTPGDVAQAVNDAANSNPPVATRTTRDVTVSA